MEGESYGANLRQLDRDVAVLKAQQADTARDVDRLGEKIRTEVGEMRREMRQALRDMTEENRRVLAAVELRCTEAIDAIDERMTAAMGAVETRGDERWSRARNWTITGLIIIVPILSALIGALVRGAAH